MIKKPYSENKNTEFKKPFDKKPYSENKNTEFKKPFDKKPYSENKNTEFKKPFDKKPYSENKNTEFKKPFDKKPYSENKNTEFKKPFDKKPYSENKNTEFKKPFDKKPYSESKNTEFEKPFRKKGLEPIIENNEPDTESLYDQGIIAGRNAVRELLKSGRTIDKIFAQKGQREGSIVVIVAEAIARNIPVIETEKAKLDALSGFTSHQGVVAMAACKDYVSIDDILEIAASRGEKPFLVIADEICDPNNLGALIRCCEGAGVHGIIIPKRRSAGLTPAVAKASAGAIEHMAIAKVTNINSAVEELKKKGLWVVSCEAGGEAYDKIDYNMPLCIIMGSEENGISKQVIKNSDYVVSLPMNGKINSLNVSCAAAVVLYRALYSRNNI